MCPQNAVWCAWECLHNLLLKTVQLRLPTDTAVLIQVQVGRVQYKMVAIADRGVLWVIGRQGTRRWGGQKLKKICYIKINLRIDWLAAYLFKSLAFCSPCREFERRMYIKLIRDTRKTACQRDTVVIKRIGNISHGTLMNLLRRRSEHIWTCPEFSNDDPSN